MKSNLRQDFFFLKLKVFYDGYKGGRLNLFEPLVNHYMKQTETETKYRKHSYFDEILEMHTRYDKHSTTAQKKNKK